MVGIIFMEMMILRMTDDVLSVSTSCVCFIPCFYSTLFHSLLCTYCKPCPDSLSHVPKLSVVFYFNINLNCKRGIDMQGGGFTCLFGDFLGVFWVFLVNLSACVMVS